MFANPFYSVALLAGVFALYWFVIRPKVAFLEVGTEVEGFFSRWLTRLHAFRTYVAGAVAGLLIAMPDLLVSIAPFDFSPLIGQEWSLKVAAALGLYAVVNRAFSTKRDEKP